MRDFSYQGRVMAEIRNADGTYGKPRWVGDTEPAVTVSLSEESETRRENYSGMKMETAVLESGNTGEISLGLRYNSIENLALGLWGAVVDEVGGTVTGEVLPADLEAGDFIALEHGGASTIVLTDADSAPLVEGENYSIDSAAGGTINILDVDGLEQPITAAYTHAGSVNVGMFTSRPPEVRLTVHQINVIGGQRQRTQLYRVRLNPVSDLDLINESFGVLNLTGRVLFDPTQAARGDLGGFGEVRQFLEAP
ncbi:hypothetical protein WCE55_02185 [Luteimonas sp. MJ293]|uniref:phage tail tube protein n=1 Tax=Luteimonas sp. MJ146 TaxID=3129240 RepID=UPI0031BA31B7